MRWSVSRIPGDSEFLSLRSSLLPRWAEGAGRAAGGFARIGYGGDFPSCCGLEEIEGIDTAVGEFAVQMKVVFGPDNGDRAVLEEGGIPDALEPRVLVAVPAFEPFLIRQGGGCAIRANREEHGIRNEELTGRCGVVGRHGVKQMLNSFARSL